MDGIVQRIRSRIPFPVRLAWKSLAGRPGNTLAVLLALSCALGAHGAVAALWSTVMRPDLPWSEPERLIRLEAVGAAPLRPGSEHLFGAEVEALQEEAESFEWVGHYVRADMPMGERGERLIRTAVVDPGLLKTLGVPPAFGRLFRDDDHTPSGTGASFDLFRPDYGEPAAILAHRLASRLAPDPEAMQDADIVLNGTRFRVVGIMPDSFFFPDRETEAWLPKADRPLPPPTRSRSNAPTFGRLRIGVSPAAAGEEATGIVRRMHLRSEDQRVQATPIREIGIRPIRTTAVALRLGAWLLVFAAAGSVVGLGLSRRAAEARNAAVRRWVGATPADEARIALVRWGLLAAGAGGGAWIVGSLATPFLRPVVGLHGPELALAWPETGEVALGTLLAAGIAEFLGALRGPGRSGRQTGTLAFLGGGVAVATVTLIITVALGGAAWRLLEGSGSYPGRRLAQLTVRFDGAALAVPEQTRLLDRLVRRIESLPEVEAAGWADEMPDAMGGRSISYDPRAEKSASQIRSRSIGPGFLNVLGIPVVAGRGTLPTDDPPAEPVVLVDRTLAADLEIGDLARLGSISPQVVGVVPDIGAFPSTRPVPTVYQPFATASAAFAFLPRTRAVVAVRFRDRVDAAALSQLAALPAETDPLLSALRVESVLERRRRSLGAPLLGAMVIGVFAACGILLALAGAIGQVADLARRSVRPVAIRQALGAPPDLVVWELTRRALFATVLGVLTGGFGGWIVTRWIAERVVWAPEAGPAAYFGPMALLTLLVGVASLVAGYRASRAEPWPRLTV